MTLFAEINHCFEDDQEPTYTLVVYDLGDDGDFRDRSLLAEIPLTRQQFDEMALDITDDIYDTPLSWRCPHVKIGAWYNAKNWENVYLASLEVAA